MMVSELFIAEALEDALDFIQANFEGQYWDTCYTFIERNWTREVEWLSRKQLDWMDKIIGDLIKKKLER